MEPGHKRPFFPALPCAASGALLSGVPRILAQAPLPPLCVALPVLQITALAICITQVPQSPDLIHTDLPFLIKKAHVFGAVACCRCCTHRYACAGFLAAPLPFSGSESVAKSASLFPRESVRDVCGPSGADSALRRVSGEAGPHAAPVLGRAGDGPQQEWGLALPPNCQSGGP